MESELRQSGTNQIIAGEAPAKAAGVSTEVRDRAGVGEES